MLAPLPRSYFYVALPFFTLNVYKHARHYLGSTNDLQQRLCQHGTSEGARLMEVVERAGIPWMLARAWKGGWTLEKQLKRRKNAPRLCPQCIQEELIHGTKEQAVNPS